MGGHAPQGRPPDGAVNVNVSRRDTLVTNSDNFGKLLVKSGPDICVLKKTNSGMTKLPQQEAVCL